MEAYKVWQLCLPNTPAHWEISVFAAEMATHLWGPAGPPPSTTLTSVTFRSFLMTQPLWGCIRNGQKSSSYKSMFRELVMWCRYNNLHHQHKGDGGGLQKGQALPAACVHQGQLGSAFSFYFLFYIGSWDSMHFFLPVCLLCDYLLYLNLVVLLCLCQSVCFTPWAQCFFFFFWF